MRLGRYQDKNAAFLRICCSDDKCGKIVSVSIRGACGRLRLKKTET